MLRLQRLDAGGFELVHCLLDDRALELADIVVRRPNPQVQQQPRSGQAFDEDVRRRRFQDAGIALGHRDQDLARSIDVGVARDSDVDLDEPAGVAGVVLQRVVPDRRIGREQEHAVEGFEMAGEQAHFTHRSCDGTDLDEIADPERPQPQ